MKSNELREKYIKFFESKNHVKIEGASLIPENDASALFTTAGMHPLIRNLAGEPHRAGKRLVNFQRCLRTGDIDEVGDDTHLTFFEMLGNWSLNDYFKKESIEFSYEFLIDVLKLDKEKIAVSVFTGDENAPRDTDSFEAWQSLGIKEEKIAFLGKKDNWWGPVGETGPCGPDTEIFYWRLKESVPKTFDPSNNGWVEIWNNVFMEYNKTETGYEKSEYKNVDTGMGLERMATILQNKQSVYETDLFETSIEFLRQNGFSEIDSRVVADHIRASIFLIADGVFPSNTDQGYVLRRFVRKAARLLRETLTNESVSELYSKLIFPLTEAYPKLESDKKRILKVFEEEVKKYKDVLSKGKKHFEKIISAKEKNKKIISGRTAFKLKDTYGLPIEVTIGIGKEENMEVDIEKYEELFKEHQEKSRKGAEGKFKGGMASSSYEITKLHTASHLLNAALKQVLGPKIHQMGSNITEERLRFDFPYPEKVSKEQLDKVEKIINEKIKEGIEIECFEQSKKEALEDGAEAQFIEKYGDIVKVYSIADFSKEICGGPHAKNTNELGEFKILKEQSSSAGVRRIKAILLKKD